jgi:tRNA U54 and U55 pseudouridine synthase Pus10
VLTRDSDLKLLESGTEEKIKEEFKRLFGKRIGNDTDESE